MNRIVCHSVWRWRMLMLLQYGLESWNGIVCGDYSLMIFGMYCQKLSLAVPSKIWAFQLDSILVYIVHIGEIGWLFSCIIIKSDSQQVKQEISNKWMHPTFLYILMLKAKQNDDQSIQPKLNSGLWVVLLFIHTSHLYSMGNHTPVHAAKTQLRSVTMCCASVHSYLSTMLYW